MSLQPKKNRVKEIIFQAYLDQLTVNRKHLLVQYRNGNCILRQTDENTQNRGVLMHSRGQYYREHRIRFQVMITRDMRIRI